VSLTQISAVKKQVHYCNSHSNSRDCCNRFPTYSEISFYMPVFMFIRLQSDYFQTINMNLD